MVPHQATLPAKVDAVLGNIHFNVFVPQRAEARERALDVASGARGLGRLVFGRGQLPGVQTRGQMQRPARQTSNVPLWARPVLGREQSQPISSAR